MAIDFSQVKTITIPDGPVKKITDSQGNILWKEQAARQWRTVWSGSISKTVSTSAGDNVDIWTNNISGTAIFRFTFTMSTSGGIRGSKPVYYYGGYSDPTAEEPDNPTRQNITYDTDELYILGIGNYGGSWYERESKVILNYSGSTHTFYLSGGTGSSGSNGTATLTITKIEQYSA